MAFWFWVVILSIVALGMYELYSRYKIKNTPLVEEPAVDEVTAEVVQAELARSNMKIAMLESRLEESETRLEEETTALTALEEQHQQQLVQTEKAYQRQMVNLSDRLAADGDGRGGPEHSPEEEYPVRMAAEVAAWRVSLGGQPLMEPAVSEDMAALADNIEEHIEAQNSAVDAASEETADPNNGSLPPMPEEEEIAPEAAAAKSAEAKSAEAKFAEAESAEAEEVVITEVPLEPEQAVLDQVVVLDEADLEIEIEEGPGIENKPPMETEEVVFEEPDETAAAVEEIPPLENRWHDLESVAMQRVMARQLGSEMDADYLDDEEFLREMGIEGEAPLLESPSEEIVETDTWITDPLEEMAHHLNGSEREPEEEQPREPLTSSDPGRQTQKITDQMWEEMIFSSAAEAGEAEESETVEASGDLEPSGVQDGELDGDDEAAAIAATVTSILSLAPGQAEAKIDEEPKEQEESGSGSSDNDRQELAAVEDIVDEDLFAGEPPNPPLVGETAVFDDGEMPADVVEPVSLEFAAEADAEEDVPEVQSENGDGPEEEPFIWQREPVLWQAEYYDNTRLSDEPVLIRQDRDIDFEWIDSAPAEGLEPRTFSVRWLGNLPLDPGQYRFTASAPDGLRLWLNERLVISAWYDQSEQTYQRDFAWLGGSIDIRVEHYENGGNAKAFLTWDRIA